MADRSGMADSIGPVQHLAKDCQSLFQEILNGYIQSDEEPHQRAEESLDDRDEILSQVAEYEDGFNAWTAFASVFAASDQSLEYRIRKHKDVHDIIIRLLELLRQSLFFVSCQSRQDPPDLGQDSVVSIALAAIKDVLSDLNMMVLRIRQSSRSSVLNLARNHAISNSGLEYLENLVLVALEALYPNAPEGLRQHLCNTMTDRYARLEHDAHRRRKTRNLYRPEIRQVEDINDLDEGKQPVEDIEVKHATYEGPKTQHMETMDQETVAKPLSSIATNELQRNLLPSGTPSLTRSLSVYKADTGLHEPPLPQFQDTDTEVECEWCGDMLNRSILGDKGWSTYGRIHYKHDLKPWPCLSRDCRQSRPSFPSRSEFLNHMRSRHSSSWLESFYGKPMWVCHDHIEESPSADGRQPIYLFSSRWESERHRSTFHPLQVWNDNPRMISSVNEVFSSSEVTFSNICPLCWMVVEDHMQVEGPSVKDDTGAPETARPTQTLQAGVKARVRFEDGSDRGLDDFHDSALPGPPSVQMELHVADHLQYLMVLSLRLANAMGVRYPEEISKSDSKLSNDAICSSVARPDVARDLHPEDGASDESSQLYLSDAEISRLEQVRHEIEATEGPTSVLVSSGSPIPIITFTDEPSTARHDERQYYTYEGDGLVPIDDYKADLRLLLKQYQVMDGVDGPFWTDKLLQHVLTRSRIKAELSLRVETHQVDIFLNHVHPIARNSSSSKYLKVFAILLLVGRPSDIGEFINEGLCDEWLPISLEDDGVFLVEEPKRKLTCFDKWEPSEKEHFETYQWMVNTPHLGPSKDFASNDLLFMPSTIKPWCLPPASFSGTKSRVLRREDLHRGDAGVKVEPFRIKIHPTAHNYQRSLANTKEFGITEVPLDNKSSFQTEWDMLDAFTGHAHPHLVTALATYTQWSRQGFIFPSPYCDLDHYLDTFDAPRGPDAPCWLSEQLSGLTGAVDTLHNPKHLKLGVMHGSISCETVLCFKRLEPQNDILLAISNPGALNFNSSENRDWSFAGYRPPEYDIKDRPISSACDIWTLGCLFLDLITWFLGGKKYLEAFRERRITMSIYGSYTGNFFTFKTGKIEGRYNVQVKSQVTEWILKLHQHRDCSLFLHDALDIVEQEMVVVLSSGMTRSSSENLRCHYERLSARCKSDSSYTQGKPWGAEKVEIARKRILESDIGFDCEISVPKPVTPTQMTLPRGTTN